ncbi:MAG: nitronate monooxygenase family protein [Myxococcales bacterium]
MAIPGLLRHLSVPVIGAPMFIVSNPALVVAQCTSGVVGSFPALNARPKEQLDAWLSQIAADLSRFAGAHPGTPVAPFAVNQIIHPSNDRLGHDLDLCEKHRVPMIITSLSAPTEVVPRVHAWGGLVFHDVVGVRHARKAIEAGVDGLILVCAGAGGHAGTQSPFALVQEVRRFWSGPLALAGAIATGRRVLAAHALGADFAYVGTRFIATAEANADARYKQMIVESSAADIVYTPHFSGVHGNYLRQSVVQAGLDPDNLSAPDKSAMSFSSGKARPWRDIWSAGQGVGLIDSIRPAAEVIATLRAEYEAARRELL